MHEVLLDTRVDTHNETDKIPEAAVARALLRVNQQQSFTEVPSGLLTDHVPVRFLVLDQPQSLGEVIRLAHVACFPMVLLTMFVTLYR